MLAIIARQTFARSHFRALQCASPSFFRAYASKSKNKGKKEKESSKPVQHSGPKGSTPRSTENLIPASQRALQDDAAQAEYDKSSTKMAASIEWMRKEVAGLTARGLGHVTPSILDPVRVVLPDAPHPHRLQEVATLGVRDGTDIIITLFDDNYFKFVEQAIYSAKLSGVVPHKVDARTMKIVVPRPTLEARAALLKEAGKIAEECRVQIRKTRDAVVRKHNWKPRTDGEELEQFQKLVDKHIKDVDQLFTKTKQQLTN